MPGITYNLDIPDAPNNPSVDQPNMKINTNAIDTLLAVDHVSFNTAGSGQHEQVTFNSNNVPGGLPTDPSSILFTKNNAAGHPYPFFLNSEAASVAAALPFLPDLVTVGSNYGFKFGKMIFNFGSATGSIAGSSVSFAIPMTSTFAITSGINNTSPSVTATFNNVTGTGFNVKSSNTNAVWYIAIGN